MSEFFERACEEVDAEVFSGDALLDAHTREEFKEYLGRWDRELKRQISIAQQEAFKEHPNTIKVWKWQDAPEEFKALSNHGGDEDWVAFVPDSMKDEYIGWMEDGTHFGCCDVSEHSVPGGVVRIGAHA